MEGFGADEKRGAGKTRLPHRREKTRVRDNRQRERVRAEVWRGKEVHVLPATFKSHFGS